jgi:hypothetical protein
MMPISKGTSGVVRHLTCFRWAKVDMPVKDHWNQSERQLITKS